jgi:Repeat of unknown function (DUF5648)
MHTEKTLAGMALVLCNLCCSFDLRAQQPLTNYYPLPGPVAARWRATQIERKGILRNVPGFPVLPMNPTDPLGYPYYGVLGEDPRFDYTSLVAEATGTCTAIDVPDVIRAGLVAPRETLAGGTIGCYATSPGRSWLFSDTFSFGAPVRKKAWDGGEFDASPMVHRRNGEPWLTVYWGYRMGAVESQFDWNEQRLRTLPEFEGWPSFADSNYEVALKTLPAPLSEGTVTEFVNTSDFPTSPGGVFFYAATDAERQALESGSSGVWQRTGKSFFHGGFVKVCRFYGSVSPGPNSHFYTASDLECDLLKSLQVKPRPLDRQQLNYEGIAFYANAPIRSGNTVTCPTQSIPLYRAYNAAYTAQGKRTYDSNHRYSIDRADIAQVVALGWIDEGIAMCMPSRKPCLPLGSVCEGG